MGRATVFLVGLAVILALLFGVVTTALAGTGVGATFNLGQVNSVNKITSLIGSATSAMLKIDNDGAGPALALQVEPGEQPMTVNSERMVARLNADKLDGKDVTQIGVNGLQRVEAESAENSVSSKQATASCPSGKVLVGTEFNIFGGKSGISPNQETDVKMDFVIPGSISVTAAAYEDEVTGANWSVKAIAICATAP